MTPNLFDCAAMVRALCEQRPGWTWHPTDERLPNGRYWVCDKSNGLWLAGHLDGQRALTAFIDAGVDLIGEARLERMDPNVVPFSFVSRKLETGRRLDGTG
jgi:hypothetical protein